jgi:hypothetical protein
MNVHGVCLGTYAVDVRARGGPLAGDSPSLIALLAARRETRADDRGRPYRRVTRASGCFGARSRLPAWSMATV